MPRYSLAIVVGCWVAYYANALPDPGWFMFAPLLAGIAWLQPRYRIVCLVGAAFLWSSAVFHYHLERRLAAEFDNRVSRLQGRIVDIPEVDPGRIRFLLEPSAIGVSDTDPPRRIRLNWYQDHILPRSGETWQFEVRLRRPGGTRNPGGFDYAAWLFRNGIDASGSVRASPLNRKLAAADPHRIDVWRARLAARIDHFCTDCRYGGVIKALAIGYRGDLSAVQRELLQASGTAHLLAISGLHIGLAGLFGLLAGRICWRCGLYRLVTNELHCASVFALSGATLYAALAGFGWPTQRALVMLGVMLFAWRCARRINLLQSVSLALGFILLLDPRAVGSPSLWLSVAALLVIAFARFRVNARGGWWRQLLILQVFFTVLFLPLGLMLFERVTPSGFVANLVAIPLVSFALLPTVLLASAGAALGAGWTQWVLALADRLLGGLFAWLEWLDGGFLESVWFAGLPLPLLLSLLPALSSWLLPVGWRLRTVACLCLLVVVSWTPSRPQQGGFELTVLDVGMGTSILLRTREHSLVYDFGPGKIGVYSAADRALLPLMRRLRIARPDLLIVSHVDQDHSGGLQSFLRKELTVPLVSGTPRRLARTFELERTPRSCHDLPPWRWDGVDFAFLDATGEAATRGSNNRSCVLRVSGRHRALLPGDIEAAQELRLLQRYREGLKTDILIAPHHGSETSSSPPFVRATDPRFVIYTVARGNRWGFPREPVLARFAARDSRQLRTDIDGAIRLQSDARGISVSTVATPPKRLWWRW